MSSVVTIDGLSKSFRRTRVLEGLNLAVEQGSVFGLIGSNGAGKTTTIKILLNILQASGGRADVLGVDSRHLGPDDYARIGYVSENLELPEWMTLSYFLAYLKPFYPTWDPGTANELIKQFDVPVHRPLKHLSRGMRMKAALISSLAYRPQLVVLDEPFSGLDPVVREDLIEGLLDCAGETTILISSHDLAEIENFASHVGFLDRGRLQFSEEMSSLTARFREIEVTLEAPVEGAETNWPATWLRREASAALVRFVDMHFDADRTECQIRERFQNVRQVSVNPMSLRQIFVTLARSRAATA